MATLMKRFARGRLSAVLAGVGFTVALAASASAAEIQPANKAGTINIDFGSAFAPTQFDRDGNVFGVRANAKGTGSETVFASHVASSPSLTPDPCSTGGFSGGWCQTPHSIAENVWGWDFHVSGAGVLIGIVDSGIDLNNPEFTGRIQNGTCFVWSQNSCSTGNEKKGGDIGISPGSTTHGTHVAGIAAGTNTGLAFGASLLPVKVCSSVSTGCNLVNDGIHYAATHGARVINVSIGGPILSNADIDSLRTSLNWKALGTLLVVSGGNSGPKDPSGGYLAGAALKDGIRGKMIVVGATGCNGPNPNVPTGCANGGLGGIGSFSQVPGNRCEIHGGQAYCLRDYFVAAPGVNIWSTVGNGTAGGPAYGYLSGTSMAAPYVTGVAALVQSQNLSLSAEQVADIIFSTTDDIGAPGTDPVYGRGEVDVVKALSPISRKSPTTHQAMIPVSGSNIATATGTRSNALTSTMSGPLAGALRQSTLLKNAIIVDSFNRPYTVDMTKFFDNRSLGLTNILFADGFTSFSPFSMALQGPMGLMQISGVGIESTTPAMLSGMYLASDRKDFQLRNLLVDAQLTDRMAMNLGYRVDGSAGLFNTYDANSSAAYNGLFVSASGVNSPYASLTDGGSFLGTTIRLADDLHFGMTQSVLTPENQEFSVDPYSKVTQMMGHAPLMDQRSATSTVASLNWDVAKWAGLGMTASTTNERNGMLGGAATSALALADSTRTTAVGISGRVGFGDGWVTTASYSEGITQLDLKPNSLVTSASDLRSRSYGVAVAKHGLFGHNDSLGLALSRPIQVYSGNVDLVAATALDTETGALTYGRENLSLATRTPETDVELGYVTTFFDGALALQTNAAYQMNLSGQNGKNALAVVSRAKINF